jgi:hypothetical protein
MPENTCSLRVRFVWIGPARPRFLPPVMRSCITGGGSEPRRPRPVPSRSGRAAPPPRPPGRPESGEAGSGRAATGRARRTSIPGTILSVCGLLGRTASVAAPGEAPSPPRVATEDSVSAYFNHHRCCARDPRWGRRGSGCGRAAHSRHRRRACRPGLDRPDGPDGASHDAAPHGAPDDAASHGASHDASRDAAPHDAPGDDAPHVIRVREPVGFGSQPCGIEPSGARSVSSHQSGAARGNAPP